MSNPYSNSSYPDEKKGSAGAAAGMGTTGAAGTGDFPPPPPFSEFDNTATANAGSSSSASYSSAAMGSGSGQAYQAYQAPPVNNYNLSASAVPPIPPSTYQPPMSNYPAPPPTNYPSSYQPAYPTTQPAYPATTQPTYYTSTQGAQQTVFVPSAQENVVVYTEPATVPNRQRQRAYTYLCLGVIFTVCGGVLIGLYNSSSYCRYYTTYTYCYTYSTYLYTGCIFLVLGVIWLLVAAAMLYKANKAAKNVAAPVTSGEAYSMPAVSSGPVNTNVGGEPALPVYQSSYPAASYGVDSSYPAPNVNK